MMAHVLSSRDAEGTTERDVIRSWIVTIGVGVVCRRMNVWKRPAYEGVGEACVKWMKFDQVDGSEQS